MYPGNWRDVCEGTRLGASFSLHYGRWLIGPSGDRGGPHWRFNQRLRVSAARISLASMYQKVQAGVSAARTCESGDGSPSCTCPNAGLKLQ